MPSEFDWLYRPRLRSAVRVRALAVAGVAACLAAAAPFALTATRAHQPVWNATTRAAVPGYANDRILDVTVRVTNVSDIAGYPMCWIYGADSHGHKAAGWLRTFGLVAPGRTAVKTVALPVTGNHGAGYIASLIGIFCETGDAAAQAPGAGAYP